MVRRQLEKVKQGLASLEALEGVYAELEKSGVDVSEKKKELERIKKQGEALKAALEKYPT